MHGNYIISDTHFNHKKIIEMTKRPFKTITDMNVALINNWNKVVSNNDTIFVLGDFAFGSKEMITAIVSKLNGRKILIMGNHDRRINKSEKFWHECGFSEVYKYPIIYKNKVILSHEPEKDIGRY